MIRTLFASLRAFSTFCLSTLIALTLRDDSLHVTLRFAGNPSPDLEWWREERGSGGSGVTQLLPDEVTSGKDPKTGENVVTSTVTLKDLQRDDLGTKIGCSAWSTDLVPAPKTELEVNMLREFLRFPCFLPNDKGPFGVPGCIMAVVRRR